jgi:hypothetical protein
MTTGRLFFVCGARRTGTTLLAAVLSADTSAPEFPGEAQLVPEWLASYRWARQHFAIRALPFFRDEDELRTFYCRFLGEFISHCRDRFGRDAAVILKSPELSLFCEEAIEIFPDARFLATIRDPRDQIASEWRVIEKRQGSAEDLRIVRERDFDALALQYVRYYEPILAVVDRAPGRIHLQKYEQLVTRPREALTELEAFTGLDLQGFDPQAAWPRVADTYWAYGTSPSDTPYYGGAIEPRRVGTYAESMSEEEARRVEAACANITSRLLKR